MSLKTKKCKIFTILDQVDESNSVCSKKLVKSVQKQMYPTNQKEIPVLYLCPERMQVDIKANIPISALTERIDVGEDRKA